LLYKSNSSNPNAEDFVTCSDYLVAYQMKGTHTLAVERKDMKDLVMNIEDMGFSVDRTISNQASICFLEHLPLTIYSERIESVYLSPSRRVANQKDEN
jgi:hypothetical protein